MYCQDRKKDRNKLKHTHKIGYKVYRGIFYGESVQILVSMHVKIFRTISKVQRKNKI